jgi:hypothetical protein
VQSRSWWVVYDFPSFFLYQNLRNCIDVVDEEMFAWQIARKTPRDYSARRISHCVFRADFLYIHILFLNQQNDLAEKHALVRAGDFWSVELISKSLLFFFDHCSKLVLLTALVHPGRSQKATFQKHAVRRVLLKARSLKIDKKYGLMSFWLQEHKTVRKADSQEPFGNLPSISRHYQALTIQFPRSFVTSCKSNPLWKILTSLGGLSLYYLLSKQAPFSQSQICAPVSLMGWLSSV